MGVGLTFGLALVDGVTCSLRREKWKNIIETLVLEVISFYPIPRRKN